MGSYDIFQASLHFLQFLYIYIPNVYLAFLILIIIEHNIIIIIPRDEIKYIVIILIIFISMITLYSNIFNYLLLKYNWSETQKKKKIKILCENIFCVVIFEFTIIRIKIDWNS